MENKVSYNLDINEHIGFILELFGPSHFVLSTHKVLKEIHINEILNSEQYELVYHHKRYTEEETTHQIVVKPKDSSCYIYLNKSYDGEDVVYLPYIYSKIEDKELTEKWYHENIEPILYDTKDENKRYFSLLCRNSNGPFLKNMPLKIDISKFLKEDYISTNYGKSFVDKSSRIVESIKTNYRGIYIFNGVPGTGKSSYIRYLISALKDMNFIWVPAKLVELLSDPDFISFFATDCSDSVFIIEDAEKIVENAHGRCDTLLNLGDGILSDAISSQIILTFNTDIGKIDQAIRRPGRLRFEHEFKKLSLEESKALASSIGLDPNSISQPKTLAEIYEAVPECSNEQNKRRIGFTQNNPTKTVDIGSGNQQIFHGGPLHGFPITDEIMKKINKHGTIHL